MFDAVQDKEEETEEMKYCHEEFKPGSMTHHIVDYGLSCDVCGGNLRRLTK